MQDNWIVEPLDSKDIEGFHRALDAVARERKYLTFLQAPSLEATRQFVLDSTRHGNPHMIAKAGSEVVGWCDIQRHPFQSHNHRGTLGMGIVAKYRGRGLGMELMTATLKAARAAGLSRIEFNVRADNLMAIALYRKAGFVEEGTLRKAVCVDGEYFDSIAMALVDP